MGVACGGGIDPTKGLQGSPQSPGAPAAASAAPPVPWNSNPYGSWLPGQANFGYPQQQQPQQAQQLPQQNYGYQNPQPGITTPAANEVSAAYAADFGGSPSNYAVPNGGGFWTNYVNSANPTMSQLEAELQTASTTGQLPTMPQSSAQGPAPPAAPNPAQNPAQPAAPPGAPAQPSQQTVTQGGNNSPYGFGGGGQNGFLSSLMRALQSGQFSAPQSQQGQQSTAQQSPYGFGGYGMNPYGMSPYGMYGSPYGFGGFGGLGSYGGYGGGMASLFGGMPSMNAYAPRQQQQQPQSQSWMTPYGPGSAGPVTGGSSGNDNPLTNGAARGGRTGFALGGSPDYFSHGAFREVHSAGLVKSPVAGRTDHIPVTVPSGSYVLPADHVSHLGQGNTLSGGKVLDRMFGLQAPAAPHLHSTIPHPPSPMKMKFAKGGAASEGKPVDIIVAGGEYLLHPDHVRRADEMANKLPPGHGDLTRGHNFLDKWVTSERAKHVKTLKSLPGPKS